MLGICSTLGKSPMNRLKKNVRDVFKHSYCAASRGLPSQEDTTISILFPTKTMTNFFWSHLFHFREHFLTFWVLRKGNASCDHFWNPCWGSVVLLGNHLWIGMLGSFLNMATELPPGVAKPRNHKDIHTVPDQSHDIFCWSHLFH